MSVAPVATAQWSAVTKKGAEPAATPGIPFDAVLSRAVAPGEGGAVSAATAAQILRLKMLSSALSLGSDEPAAASRSLDVRGLLNKFLAQLPENAANSSPPAAIPGAEPEGAPPPMAAPGASAGPAAIDDVVEKASRRYGVETGLIKAIIRAESNFNPRAVSSAGAQGLMQLMPATARGLKVSDPFDPEQNVMAGTRFLKDMLRRYGGNLDDALAAYNWGPGNVDRHGSGSLPRETRAYLGKVKEYYAQYAA